LQRQGTRSDSSGAAPLHEAPVSQRFHHSTERTALQAEKITLFVGRKKWTCTSPDKDVILEKENGNRNDGTLFLKPNN
jgi:hypothetical protein